MMHTVTLITGDGVGPELAEAARRCIEAALEKTPGAGTIDWKVCQAGVEVMETDLGEYILQLADEKPSHIVTPVAHKTKEDVAELFAEKIGIEYTTDPQALTKAAHRVLRENPQPSLPPAERAYICHEFLRAVLGKALQQFSLCSHDLIKQIEKRTDLPGEIR